MKLTGNAAIRTLRLIGLGLTAMALAWVALAQGVATTTVQGTVYLANGQPGSGTLQLSWPAFTTANNLAIAAGRTTANIGSDGFVTVSLAPNLGASPAGLFYTAIYHMSDGSTSTEYRQRNTAELLRIFCCTVDQPAIGIVDRLQDWPE